MRIIKLNPAFKPALKTDARYRVLYGGAGSGKSHYAAQEFLLKMLEHGNIGILGIRDTGKSIRNSIYQLMQNLIKEYDLTDYFITNKTEMSFTCVNGARFITSGLDDVEKLKSIVGIHEIWVEEANEISESDFNQLDLRLRGKSDLPYKITLTFNPVSELHWIKRVFFDVGKPNSFILKTTYKDNPFIDDEYKATLERLKDEDYQYYKIYALGEWGSVGNLIFTNWEKQKIDEQTFDNYFNGLDFGFADDPTAMVRLHYDKTRKTIYITEEFYQHGVFIDELAERLEPIVGREIVTCDSAEPRSIADLKRRGINAKGARKGPDSVDHGIKFLQRHKIIVNENCTNMIKELTSYRWREDKDGNIIPKPIDANNHLIDALRYALEDEMRQKQKLGYMDKPI